MRRVPGLLWSRGGGRGGGGGGGGLGGPVLEPVIRALRDTAKEPTPGEVVVFPLWVKPVFPGTLSTSLVQDQGFGAALRSQCQAGNRFVGMFLTRQPAPSGGGGPARSVARLDEIHPIGLLGSIIDIQPAGFGGKVNQVVLSGVRRIIATGQVEGADRFTVTVEDLKVCFTTFFFHLFL